MVIEMAKSVNINFKLDKDTKAGMEEVCDILGLTIQVAFTMFAKQICREKRIPLDMSLDPFYSASNVEHVLKGIRQLENGRGKKYDLIDER